MKWSPPSDEYIGRPPEGVRAGLRRPGARPAGGAPRPTRTSADFPEGVRAGLGRPAGVAYNVRERASGGFFAK